MRQSLARRTGLRRPKPPEVRAMEAEIARLERDGEDADRLHALRGELEVALRRLARVPWVDPIDMRYRRYQQVPKPSARAVMFCLMDVSGSMSETMKDLAKRFFLLLHVFLERRYKRVDLVFIRHTEVAEEVDEEVFFTDPRTGGTVVSTALAEFTRIQRERYPSGVVEHLCRAGLGRRQLGQRHAPGGGDAGGGYPADRAAFRLYRGGAVGGDHPR